MNNVALGIFILVALFVGGMFIARYLLESWRETFEWLIFVIAMLVTAIVLSNIVNFAMFLIIGN